MVAIMLINILKNLPVIIEFGVTLSSDEIIFWIMACNSSLTPDGMCSGGGGGWLIMCAYAY
jgi:hypothetical protein